MTQKINNRAQFLRIVAAIRTLSVTCYKSACNNHQIQLNYMYSDNRDWRNCSSMSESLDLVTVNVYPSGFLGHELVGWRCRLGTLVLPKGLASLGHGAWWMTGCTGRPLPPWMDPCADRLVPQKASVYKKGKSFGGFKNAIKRCELSRGKIHSGDCSADVEGRWKYRRSADGEGWKHSEMLLLWWHYASKGSCLQFT